MSALQKDDEAEMIRSMVLISNMRPKPSSILSEGSGGLIAVERWRLHIFWDNVLKWFNQFIWRQQEQSGRQPSTLTAV